MSYLNLNKKRIHNKIMIILVLRYESTEPDCVDWRLISGTSHVCLFYVCGKHFIFTHLNDAHI